MKFEELRNRDKEAKNETGHTVEETGEGGQRFVSEQLI